MHYFGRGQTDGDSVVYFPSLGVIHTGDLISDGQRVDGNRFTPVIDYNNGASARAWPATLDGALGLDFDLAIPGHGFLMSKPEVREYRDRIESLGERMAAFIRSGTTKEQIPERLNLEGLNWPVSAANFSRGLEGVYDEVAATL
jgi:glyoxylase-like metal-dependent hydrolase (beta-lactamase superfamily II)